MWPHGKCPQLFSPILKQAKGVECLIDAFYKEMLFLRGIKLNLISGFIQNISLISINKKSEHFECYQPVRNSCLSNLQFRLTQKQNKTPKMSYPLFGNSLSCPVSDSDSCLLFKIQFTRSTSGSPSILLSLLSYHNAHCNWTCFRFLTSVPIIAL